MLFFPKIVSQSNGITTIKLPGKLWKCLPVTASQMLAAEVRTEKRTAAIFIIPIYQANEIISVELPHPWWFSLSSVYEKYLVIQGYATPDMPVLEGITVMDAQTGQILWQEGSARMDGVTPAGILCHAAIRPSKKKLLDWETGEPIPPGSSIDNHTPEKITELEIGENLAYPSVFTNVHPLFKQYQDHLQQLCRLKPVMQLELITLNQSTWAMGYESSQAGYMPFLVSWKGSTLEHLIKGKIPQKGISLDSFFGMQDTVIAQLAPEELLIIR
ncbi:MAG: DUF4905 domain-containing protein [Bacteroidota bacterium]